MKERGFKLEYLEVNSDHGGMASLVLPAYSISLIVTDPNRHYTRLWLMPAKMPSAEESGMNNFVVFKLNPKRLPESRLHAEALSRA
jgi:hypothetical protein